jgi:phage terminase large subunit-like protein
MKLMGFTFKNEAKWMVIMSVAPLALAALLMIAVWLIREMR